MPLCPIYYDTETTGIKSDKDRIIEIAAYDALNNRSFEKLINPGFPIPPEASAIHHITDEMVADAPSFAQIGKEFLEFCGENFVLIAHNNDAFDKLFLESEFKRSGIEIPKLTYIDTLKWSRKYRPDLPKHSLQYLRETYGIEANNAHRALDDVIVLHQVFSYMIDDLPIEKVLELLNKPNVIERMPFGKHQGKPLQEVPKDYLRWLKESGAFDKASNNDLKAALELLGLLEKVSS
ncbi:MAG: DNA polymerase III subunit epsilon [Chlamydiae bacterium]|jgi:DNA polymerase-3 subunit epsilon|nr:DNA polymerase III subunit epsilon [Chlamydiota bacterium]